LSPGVSPGARFRELLAGTPFIAADCYSGLTARIVQEVGFPAAYMGGHSTSMMHCAVPDYGVFTSTEMIEIAGRVAEAIDIPLVVDADEAGESVASVHRAIRRYERAGLAGVHIEDELDPKHSVWDGPLLPIPDLQARVETAVNARRSDDFVVIVRSNEFQVDNGGGTGSLDEMIRRAVAAAESGADAFIPTFADERQLAAIAAEVDLPLGGYQALVPGLQFTLFTGWGVWVAAEAHRRAAAHIFEHGDLPPDFGGDFDRRTLTDQTAYDDVIRRWAERTGRPTRRLPW
jgi:2-methylisocitrate lyase-like PEP mutase family enzyme